MTQVNLFTKQKWTHRHRKPIYGYQREKGVEGGVNQEYGINRYKLLDIKKINNKILVDSTGNYIQYLVINHNGKEYEKENICVCITVNPFTIPMKLTQHCKSTIHQCLKKNMLEHCEQHEGRSLGSSRIMMSCSWDKGGWWRRLLLLDAKECSWTWIQNRLSISTRHRG